MVARTRSKPRYVQSGSGTVVIATTRALLAGVVLSSLGGNASARIFDASSTPVNVTSDTRIVLAAAEATATVSPALQSALEFSTGMSVSVGGSDAHLTIMWSSLASEAGL